MGLFGTNEKNEQTIALFGIGSGSVGGALIRFNKNALGDWDPHIVAQERTYIPFQQELNFDNFFANMQTALKSTAKKIYDKKLGAPDSIFCTMTSPWYVSETRKINFKKDTSFTITPKVMNDIINVELSTILKSYEEKYKDMNAMPYLLESKVLHTTLNGYDVLNPLGMKAKSININLFLSICPDSSVINIKDTLNEVFHNNNITFGSFILLMLIIARERLANQASYFLIDINAELTDVGIVTNGVLVATISFPMGKNYIIRQLAKELNKDEQEARSLFSLTASNTISSEEKIKIEPVLTRVRDEWTKLFKDSLALLPQTISLSSNIFLVSDNDASIWFASFLKDKDYTQKLLNQKYFDVTVVEGQKLLDICKVSDGNCDQFLMIEAIALARMLPK
ncbi:MAG: hypothetical protein QG566_432 [Patescibacteria group bacterium]|nr:hypothetical protein [Patescibacteria group bacterium]